MVINETNKVDLFNNKELPEKVFNRAFRNYYFLTSDLFNHPNNYSRLVHVLANLVDSVKDNKIYISKLYNSNYQEDAIEFVIRRNNLEQHFNWVINYSIFIQGQVVIERLGSPYHNPTIMYSDSGKWGFYYKYEDETIVIASDYPIDNLSAQMLSDFLLITIENGQVTHDNTKDSQFYHEIMNNYIM